MPFRLGSLQSGDEMIRSAEVTPSDVADAKRASSLRAPQMRPAFDAQLIDEEEDPGPIPDPS
jgi:hypothetical protein